MPSLRPLHRPGQSRVRGTRAERGGCGRRVASQREMEPEHEMDRNKRVAMDKEESPLRRFPIAVSAEEVGVLLQKARIKDVLILHMKDELCVVCTAYSRPLILAATDALSRNLLLSLYGGGENIAAPSLPTPWSLARARRPGICTPRPMRYASSTRSPDLAGVAMPARPRAGCVSSSHVNEEPRERETTSNTL
jgi:hypothetical protein